MVTESLRKRCPYSELFQSVFSHIRTIIAPNTDTFNGVNVIAVRLIKLFYKNYLGLMLHSRHH